MAQEDRITHSPLQELQD